ncbi:uncharacterized protein LOC143367860 isoform X2 [Andrena cerasifolii]|uniref:uncharacterized protein LOC143367860 isoform X2 n=1 Tax=Andrena cerasifolii TaxID=2819439 RepID=UPI00403789D6
MKTVDPIVTCPYEKSHRIRKSVLPYHLVRCGRNNTSSTKIRCPFDAFHIIEETEFESHVINCASSGNIRRHQYSFESSHQLGTVPLDVVAKLSVPIMEDWDEEYVETYDPWESTKERSIIRCIIGGSKSFKKKFRLAERARLRALEGKDIIKSDLSKCLKQKQKNYINISHLVHNMRRLYMNDFDSLLKTIDLSKLRISDVNGTSNKGKCMPEIIEKLLVQKLMLCRIKKVP